MTNVDYSRSWTEIVEWTDKSFAETQAMAVCHDAPPRLLAELRDQNKTRQKGLTIHRDPPEKDLVAVRIGWSSPQCVACSHHLPHPVQVGVQPQDSRVRHRLDKVGVLNPVSCVRQREPHTCGKETELWSCQGKQGERCQEDNLKCKFQL